MKKTITILGALALASSPALALNLAPYKTQNLANILKTTSQKANGAVNNNIIVQSVGSYHFYFQAQLSNSNYNGFPGFMSQIKAVSWPLYFFQWLDDNDFYGNFPNLSNHTVKGFFHDPITWANRLEEQMGHFGSLLDNKSQTAYGMITGYDHRTYLDNFGSYAEKTYNQDAKTGKVAGIDLNFGFTYHYGDYYVAKPNFVVIMNQ